MSARSFRDRYHNLARLAGVEPDDRLVDDPWPLPDGARLAQSSLGVYATSERLYTGAEVERARELLTSATPDPAESYVFLDTETTGLSGGTGTYVFLVGLGAFDERGFAVRQLFMRHPGEELGMLLALGRELEEFAHLVTFNGRSFDVPLLESRYRMHHRPFAGPRQHLDLLPAARALWKHRLPSCALGSLEATILGVERELDAPGWLIPSIYFAYLRNREIGDLNAVLEHNRHDVLSLARLTALVAAYQSGILEPDDPIDRAALALRLLRNGPEDHHLARAFGLWRLPTVPSTLRFMLLKELSAILKQGRRHPEIVPEWELGIRDPYRAIRFFSAEELAKFYEHQQRDYERALSIVQRASDGARLAREPELLASFLHRAQRLERKMGLSN